MESKKHNKLVNITKNTQTHKFREQTSEKIGREKRGTIISRVGNQEVKTTMYKINKLQGYIVQHREYIHYFIITVSEV